MNPGGKSDNDPTGPSWIPLPSPTISGTSADRLEAKTILMEFYQSDLRCLDVPAHLGNFVFDSIPEDAIRRCEVGLRIMLGNMGETYDTSHSSI